MIGNGVRKTLAAVTNNDSIIFAAVLLMSMEERIWETALPLPSANKTTQQHLSYFLLKAKCWLRGGVGGQLPKKGIMMLC